MKRALRRREITARQREGLYKNLGNGSTGTNREKRRSRSNDYYGASEEPEYENMKRSASDERERESREKGNSFHNRNTREANRRTQGQRNSNRSDEDEERYFGRERNNKEDGIRSRSRRNYNEFDNENYYGEHPDSMGYEEYRGGNKRHPGLLGSRNRRQYRELYQELDRDRREENERRYRNERNANRTRNHRNDTQFRMGDYDPIESECEKQRIDDYTGDNFIYKYKGYQHSGGVEGFGKRRGRQKEHEWFNEDEYREGHAPRPRGSGRFGSRKG